jgi:hypothetical protein
MPHPKISFLPKMRNRHAEARSNLYNLGLIQHDLGHDADAEKYYREALGVKQSWYGKEHPDTALITAAVGQSLWSIKADTMKRPRRCKRRSPYRSASSERCIPRLRWASRCWDC